ncbi:hypothetical protein RCL1_008012 [Eukaryota sp. TZLM3-RCL]
MDPDLQVNEVSNSVVFFGSEQYKELLSGVLQKYGKSTEDVCFITGDKCATNKKLANLIEVPLVGCVSHRWALEMKKYGTEFENVLKKIDQLFSLLRTAKRTLILRTLTNLRPQRRNATRWSSSFQMIKRFKALYHFLDHFNNDSEVVALIFTSTRNVFD